MDENGFTHLHVHSEYSLLDGAASIKKLVNRCKALGMGSLALTDHGNMFGAVAFYREAMEAGIKPILGIEAYIAPGARTEREAKGIGEASYHMVLLAANNTGYHNLLKLASIGYLEGFYYRPRIDREVLEQHQEGLICTSACLSGEIPCALSAGNAEEARKTAEYYLKLFGEDRFFIEIQSHCADQEAMNPLLVDLADQVGAALVATNDVHFLEAEDHHAHAVLTCISTGKNIDDEKRMQYPAGLYMKSPAEMREQLGQWGQACDNTERIAEKCNVELDFSTRHAPVYQPPAGKTAEGYLEELCREGLVRKYGEMNPELEERLTRELSVIQGKGFASYFLIVWDFMHYALERGIPCGTRGSGVGTLVGYALDMCNADPLRYGLLFERFMDPERNEMPDIDVDICQNGRAEVIDYVREKYGYVAQIITFGTMKARAVIRDVCRVLAVPLGEADKLAKLVPETLGITLEEALASEPRLREWCGQDAKIQEVIDVGRRLEGLARHASVHAAGVVVADEPLDNFLPLYKAADSDEAITQFDGPTVERVGLLKMDFLGLRTLSTIERARQLVALGKGKDIDPNGIDLTDKKVLRLFAKGQTKGVFQFESAGMRDLLQKMRPNRIEDLIAANALYRPGPMELIPDYNSRKHGQAWSVPHPIMEEVLEETHGIMVYQEQVMMILNRLGDIPLARAYKLIKAISKKNFDVIKAERDTFITGCVGKDIAKAKAEEVFDLIERFGGYGFNKSHSTQYSILAFQTAYFKAYYPTEFMAAVLTFEMGSVEKVAEYIDECRAMKIEVLPPDVNESFADFTVIYESEAGVERIRFGLAAVKGVGTRAVEEIIRVREEHGRIDSIFNLCQQVDSRTVNKGALEALIKAGALDSLGGNRHQMMTVLEEAIRMGNEAQRDRQQGQLSFFEAFEEDEDVRKEAMKLPEVRAWPKPLMLQYEKDVLGLYVTSHPLADFAEDIDDYSTAHSNTLSDLSANAEVIIGGIISRVRFCVTKNGRGTGSRMAMITLEDLNGSADAVIFPDCLAQYGELVQQDQMVFLKGTVDFRREDPSIRVNAVYDLTRAAEELARAVMVELGGDAATAEKLAEFKQLCESHAGRCPVYVSVRTASGLVVVIQIAASVYPDTYFCRKLEALAGEDNYRLLRPHDTLKGTVVAKSG